MTNNEKIKYRSKVFVTLLFHFFINRIFCYKKFRNLASELGDSKHIPIENEKEKREKYVVEEIVRKKIEKGKERMRNKKIK